MVRFSLVNCLLLISLVRGEPVPCCGFTGVATKLVNSNISDVVTDWKLDISGTEALYGPINCWDTSEVTEMNWLFTGVSSNFDVGCWDVSNVQLFLGTFAQSNFNNPLSAWDTSSAIEMEEMFADNAVFDQDLSNFVTASVRSFTKMFDGSTAFTGTGLQDWDVARGVKFSQMFLGASSFAQDLCPWLTLLPETFQIPVHDMFTDTTCPEQGNPDLTNPTMTTMCHTCYSMPPSTAPSVSNGPSAAHSSSPTAIPSMIPSNAPTGSPSSPPTTIPSSHPSEEPTVAPTAIAYPSGAPSSPPTSSPSQDPTSSPSLTPSTIPTTVPSVSPSLEPSESPTIAPSATPSSEPSASPTSAPSAFPSVNPDVAYCATLSSRRDCQRDEACQYQPDTATCESVTSAGFVSICDTYTRRNACNREATCSWNVSGRVCRDDIRRRRFLRGDNGIIGGDRVKSGYREGKF